MYILKILHCFLVFQIRLRLTFRSTVDSYIGSFIGKIKRFDMRCKAQPFGVTEYTKFKKTYRFNNNLTAFDCYARFWNVKHLLRASLGITLGKCANCSFTPRQAKGKEISYPHSIENGRFFMIYFNCLVAGIVFLGHLQASQSRRSGWLLLNTDVVTHDRNWHR